MAGTEQRAPSLPKQVADRVGRTFNLLFNRVIMYHLDHPSTKETVSHLQDVFREALQHVSPLALVLDKERIFVEEEPLDPRVNAQRLVAHMKKVGVQSVSFERGMLDPEVAGFAKVFGDAKTYPTADAMKQGLTRQGVQRIRINHVFFKKMTADEELVERGEGPRGVGGGPGGVGLTKVLVDTSSGWGAEAPGQATEAVLSEQEALQRELYESLTLSQVLADPSAVSEKLLGGGAISSAAAGGGTVLQGVRKLRSQVEDIGPGTPAPRSMEALVEAVLKLKEELSQGIQARKERGELVIGEEAIHQEMDGLTDQVMVQLIREEYRKGEVSVKRLAQIIRRMMPDIRELKRLLPKLKEGLLAEGMPLSDYLQLIRELERELQSEELAVVLEEGAEEIGLSAEELIREIRKDPKSAAELVALAGELRALGVKGDRGLLSQILVDYVEKVSAELALDRVQKEGPDGVHQLREIVSQVQRDLLEKLRARLGDSSLVRQVQEGMKSRQEESLQSLKGDWVLRVALQDTQTRTDPQRLLKAVESAYPDQGQQGEIVNVVIQAMEARGIDPGPLRATLAQKTRVAPGEGDPQKAPKGAYNKNMILFCLREEVKRAKRYPYQFSALSLSARLAVALRPVPIGLIRPHEIRNAVMTRAMEILREMDLIGVLEDNKALALLPFTGANGAQVVRRRIMEAMDGQTLTVRNVPMRVKLAVAEETFEKDRIPSLPNFLGRLEARHAKLLKP